MMNRGDRERSIEGILCPGEGMHIPHMPIEGYLTGCTGFLGGFNPGRGNIHPGDAETTLSKIDQVTPDSTANIQQVASLRDGICPFDNAGAWRCKCAISRMFWGSPPDE